MSFRKEKKEEESSSGTGLALAAGVGAVIGGAAMAFYTWYNQKEEQPQPAPSQSGSNHQYKPRGIQECSICTVHSTIHLPCGHVFCAGCVSGWLQANKTCPNCRKRYTQREIDDILGVN